MPIDWITVGLYDSKQDNKAPEAVEVITGEDMANCPNIKMPTARDERYAEYAKPFNTSSQQRVVDLEYEHTPYRRAQAFVAIGIAMNSLGKTFKLKEKYSFAAWSLQRARVRFEIVYDDEPVHREITH